MYPPKQTAAPPASRPPPRHSVTEEAARPRHWPFPPAGCGPPPYRSSKPVGHGDGALPQRTPNPKP